MEDRYLDKIIEDCSNQYEVGDIDRYHFYQDIIKDYVEMNGVSNGDREVFKRWNESLENPIDIDWDFVEEKVYF